jgi:hypothetical protein
VRGGEPPRVPPRVLRVQRPAQEYPSCRTFHPRAQRPRRPLRIVRRNGKCGTSKESSPGLSGLVVHLGTMPAGPRSTGPAPYPGTPPGGAPLGCGMPVPKDAEPLRQILLRFPCHRTGTPRHAETRQSSCWCCCSGWQ